MFGGGNCVFTSCEGFVCVECQWMYVEGVGRYINIKKVDNTLVYSDSGGSEFEAGGDE